MLMGPRLDGAPLPPTRMRGQRQQRFLMAAAAEF